MLDTGKSLFITKLKFCFWEYLQTYIKSNRMWNIHGKKKLITAVAVMDLSAAIDTVSLHLLLTALTKMIWN